MTFGELPIGSHFVMADSPMGEIKTKSGFHRWRFANHRGFLPTAVGCCPDREVIVKPESRGDATRTESNGME